MRVDEKNQDEEKEVADRTEQEIADRVKKIITGKEDERGIKGLIQKEIIASKYMEASDWHAHYAIDRIYPLVEVCFLKKAGTLKDNKEITQEIADDKGSNSFLYVWIAMFVLIESSLRHSEEYSILTPLIFGFGSFYFINRSANKSLNNNTSIPTKALRAKRIGKALIALGICISLINIVRFRIR